MLVHFSSHALSTGRAKKVRVCKCARGFRQFSPPPWWMIPVSNAKLVYFSRVWPINWLRNGSSAVGCNHLPVRPFMCLVNGAQSKNETSESLRTERQYNYCRKPPGVQGGRRNEKRKIGTFRIAGGEQSPAPLHFPRCAKLIYATAGKKVRGKSENYGVARSSVAHSTI